jgi:hypothetical protein
MKKILLPIALVVLAITLFLGNSQSAKAYSNNNLINDAVFDNAATMSAADIQVFLNKFPNSCLKNYSSTMPDADPYKAYFTYGGSGTAAQIIRRVADVWGINPQVILAKLEQEESLVRGNAGCPEWRYNSAMGMGCPDGGACPAPGYEGFTKQVTKGAWQLKWNKEAANGNVNWQGNGDLTYGGKMTQGNRKRCNTCQSVYYDGYYSMDGALAHMDTGATAALYTYTPHVPSSFPGLFQTFFNVDPSTGIGAPIANAVYRVYLKWNGEHFYSNNYNEIVNIVARGAQYEGIHFLAPSNLGTVPLYRFWVAGNFHFYTQDVGEYNAVIRNPSFRSEGLAWNVYRTQVPGTVPIYRLYKRANGDHLYTASAAERDAAQSLGYIYEGVHFYNSSP